MKTVLVILGIVIIGGGIWYATKPAPDASVPTAMVSDVNTTTTETSNTNTSENTTPITNAKSVDNANVKITFKGFGPDKIHNGLFSKIDSRLAFDASGNLKGDVIVDMTSLTADNLEKLTPHLKSADFFDVAKYPTATFKASSVSESKATGKLTVHGVTKDVSFPIVKTDTEYKATFNIDMKEFGIVQKFANEVVEITVTVPLK